MLSGGHKRDDDERYLLMAGKFKHEKDNRE